MELLGLCDTPWSTAIGSGYPVADPSIVVMARPGEGGADGAAGEGEEDGDAGLEGHPDVEEG